MKNFLNFMVQFRFEPGSEPFKGFGNCLNPELNQWFGSGRHPNLNTKLGFGLVWFRFGPWFRTELSHHYTQ